MSVVQLLVFAMAWVVIVYVLNSLFTRRLIHPDLKKVLLYVVTMAALGLIGEVIFDTVYRLFFGQPLWEYRVLPIHNAYTSVYSLFLWGAVGLHLCLSHSTLKKNGIVSVNKLAAIFCLEAIVLEALVNLSFLAAFGEYIYYYHPTDLWHITSVQTLPLYLLAGYITVIVLKFASRRQWQATLGSSVLAVLLVSIGWFSGRG